MERTLQNIRNCTSLNNLKKAKPKAQVATLLILIITALLIFILVVANIGQVSNYATNLSNAADKASMYLASMVGTKSFQLSVSLYKACENPIKCCVKTGMLSTILAIIFAIIAVILGPVGWIGLLIATAAGALGGAIGGGIAGTGVAQGAIQGAMIGAAIGVGSSAGPELLQGVAGLFAPTGTITLITATGVAVGASLGVTLSAASSIYSAYAKDAMLGDAMAAAVKALNGLPEKTRRRESVFLQALTDTIDDPNKVQDTFDSDGDGDTTETVPNFQFCWDRRITEIKNGVGVIETERTSLIRDFISGPAARFQNATNTFLSQLGSEEKQGSIIWLFNALEGPLESPWYDVCFWKRGLLEEVSWDPFSCNSCPKPSGPCAPWNPETACPVCVPPPPPGGYDEVDYVIGELADFNALISELTNAANTDISGLASSWESWISWLYEPETEVDLGDYYHIFDIMLKGDPAGGQKGLNKWISNDAHCGIEDIRGILPICNPGCEKVDEYGNPIVDEYGNPLECTVGTQGLPCSCCIIAGTEPNGKPNPPCRQQPDFGTVNLDCVDDFVGPKSAIKNFIDQVGIFMTETKNFYDKMASLPAEAVDPASARACGLAGTNPVFYNWTDSRGGHTIAVTIGSYSEPRLVSKKYGNFAKGKKCTELKNYKQNVTVTIQRQDPHDVGMGVLGRWNPFVSGRITRKSVAQYKGLKSAGNDKCHPAGWVKVVEK